MDALNKNHVMAGKGGHLALEMDLAITYYCASVWQRDRIEINTPLDTNLTKVSTTSKTIFLGISNKGPHLVWHPRRSPSKIYGLLDTFDG